MKRNFKKVFPAMGILLSTAFFSPILFTGIFAQESEEVIPWSADRKLKWSDFKGKFLKTEWAAATTASSISYSFSTYEKMVVGTLILRWGASFIQINRGIGPRWSIR